jgi:hypothetical protein
MAAWDGHSNQRATNVSVHIFKSQGHQARDDRDQPQMGDR